MSEVISINISASLFRSLSVDVQDALLTALRGDQGSSMPPLTLGEAGENENDLPSKETIPPAGLLNEQTDLSPAKFKKLVDGCSPKTRTALKAMIEGPTPVFKVAEVAKAVGCAPKELVGVWGGITKRVRTVTGDPEAYLWGWGEDIEMDGKEYINQSGWVSEMTYHSGRRVFGL